MIYDIGIDIPEDTNFVARSDSWLAGFAPENRNYLILPELDITDDAHFLSWKSGAFQGPRYMDGYSVGIVTDASDPESSYVNLWTAAQFVADDNSWHPALYGDAYDFSGCPVPDGPLADQDMSAVCYYPTPGDGFGGTGYVHADNFTNTDYLAVSLTDPDNDNTYTCVLEPHTLDLSAYIGESIRICFLHDSDDDNIMTIDDIMVHGPDIDGIDEFAFDRFISIYPNPVVDVLNFNFTEEVKDNAIVNIIDSKGALVYSEIVNGNALKNAFAVSMTDFSAGLYSVSVTIDNERTVSDNIIKR